MKFQTQYNYDPSSDSNFNIVDDVIVTIPDDSLTIQEILTRFSVDGWTSAMRGGSYTGSSGDDFNDYDPSEDPGFDLADYSTRYADLQSNIDRYRASQDSLNDPSKAPDPQDQIKPDLVRKSVDASASAPDET